MQLIGKSLYEAWEHFKSMLRKCPHHGLQAWLQIQIFYNGVDMSQLMTMFQKKNGQRIPSNTKNNPRRDEKEHVNAFDLRLGKTLEKLKTPTQEENKDVVVKVQRFIISVNFVFLDFEEDREIPILLGRPFLATYKATIDLEQNKLIMKIDGEIEVFKCGHDSQKEGLD
ncbi:Retrovirus-related Pol polyprotein from transposon opus [Gossypium australe]|uniref:Retrovirus-related Pol polyprotein from transposon opus n=1 Tax=Gossypium australe TaxID=47621 RepID=A0A5B6VLB9_9ROSI|nr:Retrovirus-related Pol polyprotein from transposon opus [Gossypium australe]